MGITPIARRSGGGISPTSDEAPKVPYTPRLRAFWAHYRVALLSLTLPCHRWGVGLVAIALVLTFFTPQTVGTHTDLAAELVSGPIHQTFLTVAILTLLFVAYKLRCRLSFWKVAVVLLVETAIMQVTKLVTFYVFHLFPRPSGNDGGFPSGHAAVSCATAFLLAERFPALAPLWYGLAAAISWSRWEAGAHYPYQIVAGAILGLMVAALLSPCFTSKPIVCREAPGYNEDGDHRHEQQPSDNSITR